MSHVTVTVPLPMRRLTGGVGLVSAQGDTVNELLVELDERYPGFRAGLMAEDGKLLRYINIYVNSEDIRYSSGLSTIVRDGDRVQIIPAAAGGSR